MIHENMKTFAIATISAVMAVICITAISALADGDSSTDSVPKWIPYQGTLEKDGRVVNGDIQMIFRIYDGSEAEQSSWSETQTVTVYAGRFSVLLGSISTQSSQTLMEVIHDADELYLGVALTEESEEIALANRQRLLPVPFAMWATASHNLKIYGTDITFGPHPTRGDGGRALVHYDNDQLVLNFAEDFSGGVKIQGKVNMRQIVGGGAGINLGSSDSRDVVTVFGSLFHYGARLFLTNGAYNPSSSGDALWAKSGDKLEVGLGFSGGIELMENTSMRTGKMLDVKPTMDCECEWVDVNTPASSGDTSEWHCPAGKYIHGLKQEDNCGGGNDNCIQEIWCCRPCNYYTAN